MSNSDIFQCEWISTRIFVANFSKALSMILAISIVSPEILIFRLITIPSKAWLSFSIPKSATRLEPMSSYAVAKPTGMDLLFSGIYSESSIVAKSVVLKPISTTPIRPSDGMLELERDDQ